MYNKGRAILKINDFLRTLRIEKGIKLRELARNIGYSHGQISAIETGSKKLSQRLLNKYVKAVCSNEDEYKNVKKKLKDEYSIELQDDYNTNYTLKVKRPISLNNLVENDFEIDGIKLSMEESKLIIATVRGYREVRGI